MSCLTFASYFTALNTSRFTDGKFTRSTYYGIYMYSNGGIVIRKNTGGLNSALIVLPCELESVLNDVLSTFKPSFIEASGKKCKTVKTAINYLNKA